MLGLGRSDPLQQISAGDQQAYQRAENRIRHQPCLIGQERHGQADLRKRRARDRRAGRADGCAWRCPPKRGLRPTRKGMSAGIAIIARTNLVHIQGETCGSSQPTSMREKHAAEPKACGADCRTSSSGQWRESEYAPARFSGHDCRGRKSRAAAASLRAPSDAGGRRPPHSAREIRRTARCPWPARRARRCLRRDRG